MANTTEAPTRPCTEDDNHDSRTSSPSPGPVVHEHFVDHCDGAGAMTPLHDYLIGNPKADRRLLLQQVAIQLAMYHNVQRLVYGDVKMTSITVNEHGVAILAKSGKTVPITSQPRAPESREERLPMTTATDLYAFAWLAFQVYTDIDPLVLARDPKTMNLIASGVKPNRPGPYTPPSQRGLNDTLWSVMLMCWSISPVERPLATEVVHALDLSSHIVSGARPAYGHELVAENCPCGRDSKVQTAQT